MGGTAADFGSFMKILVNDQILKDLMLIPSEQQTDYARLINDYFVETYVCDTITENSVCRLLIHSMPQSHLYNNQFIKRDNFAIEIFVPNSLDRVEGFERRSNQIIDRLIELFNNQTINYRKLSLEARHELASSIPNFCRMYVQFSYKRVYG